MRELSVIVSWSRRLTIRRLIIRGTGRLLICLLSRQRSGPSAVAVIDGDRELSYGELDAASNRSGAASDRTG